MPRTTVKGYKCERCNYAWVPRTERKPLTCPKCRSPYWDKPRRLAKLASEGDVR